jgi:hypothetical protein
MFVGWRTATTQGPRDAAVLPNRNRVDEVPPSGRLLPR